MRFFSLYLLVVLSFWSCSHPLREPAFLLQVLEREHLTDSNALILYIEEGMCAECINRELLNLNEHPFIASRTLLIGRFSVKRHFFSAVASISVRRKIFLPAKEMPEIEMVGIRQPHYIFYHSSRSVFEDPYYPADCSRQRTLDYYRSLRPFLTSSVSGLVEQE